MEVLQRVKNYWTERSDTFGVNMFSESEKEYDKIWTEILEEKIALKSVGHVLDIGTGPGYFALNLALMGYQVTGIDLTPALLERAKEHAVRLKCDDKTQFLEMNAQSLEFEDGSFDVVVTRNLTWTLPSVEEAYIEWKRVLKPGGRLINFDSDYGAVSFIEQKKQFPHKAIDTKRSKECDEIKDCLSISQLKRPQWDINFLDSIGMKGVSIEDDVRKRFPKELNYERDGCPLFCICMEK
ncbi:class I SAM-dependent methyltransferase [Acetobacterium sp.]|jgi:SAM-dependent methyltransferase|uniref:class I SAM-dependent methyltransferase n=1 Tax=Acetobacterium sp. TaxID=1872094 RepID=UPI000CA9FDE3|nr:class I SAM-dependent methyltransferase [Acetobacterium sp.]MDO9491528.1 class I SAM-dependent methyltransferase [Acetobacterium sp.]PKM75439.1 MAG: class I SAM-dependent methyltransferase [Firmicutes bacterium HGW-Firmicutes-17]